MPDADLVGAALRGDKESLGVLIRRHWRTATFLASKVLGSAELAGDAAQEAAIAAMTGLDRLRSPDRFGAWFCGITLNIARRSLRQIRAEPSDPLPDVACTGSDPAEAAELADIAARVREAIALLADGQAEAVRLFYLQGLSHREVASELGISPGAVKARLHQARAALAPRLARTIDTREATVMTGQVTANKPGWVDAEASEIRRTLGDDDQAHYIMVLTEVAGNRVLPIWIGRAEATALALTLESAEMPRPFTYKLAADLVAASGAEFTEVRITRLVTGVFYALVLVRTQAGVIREVDARPSDAVTIAVTSGAPIRVGADLFEDARAHRPGELASLPVVTADIAARATSELRAFLTPQAGDPDAASGS